MIDVEMLRPTTDEMLSGLTAGDVLSGRIKFQAKALDALSETAGEMLSGLHATPALRHRILVAAERRRAGLTPVRSSVSKKPALSRLTPALGMAMVMTLMIGLGIFYAGRPLPSSLPSLESGMENYTAGDLMGASIPQYRSIWAGQDVNPPLLLVNGRYYRMLTEPVSASSSLIDKAIAEVQGFAEDLSLSATVGILSNVAPVGSKIYSIEGVSHKTACLAEVDGVLRVFQRVGYASETIFGNEMFEDTLNVYGMVEALELSGVGIIDDENKANELIYMLSEFAVYHSSEIESGQAALTIYLKNGLTLQLAVQDDVLGGCGAWACPQFFESFRDTVAESNNNAA